MILEIASLCILGFVLALLLHLMVLLAIVPSVEVTPPEPQQGPVRRQRGARRQLHY